MPEPTARSIFSRYAQAATARRRLAKEELYESQRGRLLQAVVSSAAEKGYAATTVADVVARAAVSRNAFYDHFSDKEECFLAALTTGGELLAAEVLAVPPDPDDWRGSTRGRIRTFLAALDDMPDLSRAMLLESGAAGLRAHQIVGELRARFAEALHDEQKVAARHDHGLPVIPKRIFQAVVGGLLEVVRVELLKGPDADMPSLEDDLVVFLRMVHEADPDLLDLLPPGR